MQTKSLRLRPHIPAHLIALSESEGAYEKISGCKAAQGIREFLLMASPKFFQSLQSTSEPDPWKFGFAIFHTADKLVSPPDAERCVEIGYSIAPAYQGQGLATETARALIDFATPNQVRKVRAHTLAEINASSRVLEKCGFIKTAEIAEPKGKLIWRWERSCSSPCRG